MNTDEDKIEKVIELDASVSRVWRALTDFKEFGQWFRVKLDGPFEPGALSTGNMTYPGYEHYPWLARVERMDHESLFSFRWHDFDDKSDVDVSLQPTTLVEFRFGFINAFSIWRRWFNVIAILGSAGRRYFRIYYRLSCD